MPNEKTPLFRRMIITEAEFLSLPESVQKQLFIGIYSKTKGEPPLVVIKERRILNRPHASEKRVAKQVKGKLLPLRTRKNRKRGR